MARPVNGAAVRAIRQALGISQASLARRARIAESHLSQVERGINGASPEVTRRLADELGVSFAAITSAEPEPETVTA